MIRNNYTAVDYKAISGMKEMIPEIISGLAVSYSEYDKEKDEWRGFIECNSGKLCLTAIGDEENETNEYLTAIINDIIFNIEGSVDEDGAAMRSSTETIIGALHVLARDIQTDDGVINACLSEAAERLEELSILVDQYKIMASSQWTRIDYANLATYPEENRPCIVAWENHPEHPDRHAMHVFNDVGDDMRLWQNAIGDEVHDWDGTLENPTHWMYAPEYQPSM